MLGPPARFRLAARALALGVPYEGADFRLDPPRFDAIATPSIAVIGTGKRVGQDGRDRPRGPRLSPATGASSSSRWAAAGPPEPELVETRPTVADLLALSRAGRHAASDHLETAALTGPADDRLPPLRRRARRRRRASRTSLAGVRLAEALDPDLIVLDGSGAAIPPIAADRRILVVGAHQDAAVATGYLNPYRALLADLVVVAMAEDGADHAALAAAFGALTRPGVPVMRVVLRPRPLERRARPPDRVLRHRAGRAARDGSPRTSSGTTAPT